MIPNRSSVKLPRLAGEREHILDFTYIDAVFPFLGHMVGYGRRIDAP
jgi:hypothetical protein